MEKEGHMKKTLTVICLVILASWPAFGSGFKFYFGPAITNINVSGITYLLDAEKKSMLQLTGGMGFELSLGTHLALELDLMYMPGGARWEATVMGTTASETYKGYAVSMPLLFKGFFLTGTTPYVLAGGALAYTTSQNLTIDFSPYYYQVLDFTSSINRVQFCLIFGGGLNIAISSMNFLVEFRYALGLSELAKHPGPGESVKVSNILILAGYKF
jgi:hypothetical protein